VIVVNGLSNRAGGYVSPMPSIRRESGLVRERPFTRRLLALRRLRVRLDRGTQKDRPTRRSGAVARSDALSLIRALSHICGVCFGLLTVEYELSGDRGGRYRLQKWDCPHCGAPNTLNLSGRIRAVTKRAPDQLN